METSKKSIRIICGKPYLEHSTPLFHTNKIVKAHDLYRYQLTLHFYKTKKNIQVSRIHKYSALGNFDVGNVAVRNFAIGNFAVWNFFVCVFELQLTRCFH